MALFQPSNITPSSFAGIGGGVVDVNDNVSISWQVNGNSVLARANMYIYTNDAASTLVHNFNIVPTPAFYGTDENGNINRFVYEPGTTWAANGLSNGNSYKLIINQYWFEGEDLVGVQQSSPVVFVTRAAPTLTISPASGTIDSVTKSFTASYSQAQYDSITWVRWVLSDGNGNILDDTGTIYTGKLQYSYNGFFSGQTYTLSCTVETSSGAEKTATNTYTCSYDSASASGGITAVCNPDDSVTLSWAAGADIPGTPSAQDYGSIVDGVLHLAANRSILWNQVNGGNMSFAAPYAFAWRGEVGTQTTNSQTINSGTWTKVKDPTATGTTNQTLTVSNLTLTKPYTGNNTHQVSVSAPSYITINETYTTIESGVSSGRYYQFTGAIVYSYYIERLSGITGWSAVNNESATITDTSVTLSDDHRTISYTAKCYGDNQISIQMGLEGVRKYVGYADYTPPESGVSNPYVVSSSLTDVTVAMSGSAIRTTIQAGSSGTYTVTIGYSYSYTGNDSYSGSVTGSLPSSTGTLTGASVTSTTGTGGATVSTSGNNYTITIRNSSASSCTATVKLTYTYQTSGNDAYRTIVTGTLAGAVSGTVTSTTAAGGATVSVTNGSYTVTMYHSSATARTATVSFAIESIVAHNPILTLASGSIVLRNTATAMVLSATGMTAVSLSFPAYTHSVLATVTPTKFGIVCYDFAGNSLGSFSSTISLPASTISSVTLGGGAQALNTDYVYITSDVSYNFPTAGSPGWSGSTLFNASFTENLQAGTLASSYSLSVALYRRSGNALVPLGVYNSDVSSIRDYGIRSLEEYSYVLYYISDDTYSVGMTSDEICKQFRQYTLIEAEQDAEDGTVYHPVSVWRFRDNIEAGSVSNGNTPALLENFTRYPHWQPSSQEPKSGTLNALLSFFSEGEYIRETAEDMEKLYALSHSLNALFMRDMKGNLYMVKLSGPVSQTINNQTGMLSVTVSVPWIEVGDARDVKIIAVED